MAERILRRSVNAELQDRAIRHQLYLTRLGNRQAKQIRQHLTAAHADLMAQLERRLQLIEERGFDLGPATTARLRELTGGIGQMTKVATDGAQQQLRLELAGLPQDEARFQVGLAKATVPTELHLELVLPAPVTLQAVVEARPFGGRLLSEWFDGLAASQQSQLMQAIRLGVTQGQTTAQIAQRIRGTRAQGYADGILEIGRVQAEAVARTAVMHISTQARQATFEANSDLVKGVIWVATLDSSTCPTCGPLDGKVFPVDSGPRPPLHVNCRCTCVPQLRSWKELGIDAKELGEGTRASMDGQVPDSMTWSSWLRSQVNAGKMDVVNEALGPTRAKLFAAGGVKAESFVNREGRLLSLDQLRAREPDAFSQLKLL